MHLLVGMLNLKSWIFCMSSAQMCLQAPIQARSTHTCLSISKNSDFISLLNKPKFHFLWRELTFLKLVWTIHEVLTPILPPTSTATTDELVLKVALNLKENNIGHFYCVVSYWQKHIALYRTNNNGEVRLRFIFSIPCQGKPQETVISLDSFSVSVDFKSYHMNSELHHTLSTKRVMHQFKKVLCTLYIRVL